MLHRSPLVLAVASQLAATAAFAQQPESNAPSGLETILVTERSLQSEIDVTPGGITLIDGEALRERNVSSMADMLRYVPGVWSANDTGSDDIFLSSRGSNLDATDYDMNGVRLLQDGLPVTTADGNNHNRVLDPLSARYATFARGANAMRYGATTLGGAVDFVTPTARNGAARELFVNAGSHGQRLLRGSLSKAFDDTFDGLVTLENKKWDGYRDHDRQSRTGLYANAGWQGADAASRFFLTSLDNDQELPSSLTREEVATDRNQAAPAALTGNYQLDVSTLRLANKTVWQLGAERSLELGISYEEQELFHPIVDVRIDFDGAGGNPPVQVFSLLIDTDHRDAGTVLRYRQRAGDHDFVVGFGYGDSRVDGAHYGHDGGRPSNLTTLIDNRADNLEVYAADRWRLNDRLLVELAAQAVRTERDVRQTDATSGTVRNLAGDYSDVNPRVGVVFAIGGDVDLFANVSRLYEPPTTFELEDEVTDSGALLAAMHGTVYEIGFRGRRMLDAGGDWGFDVAYYHAEIRDEILSRDDPGAPGTSLSANVPRTTHAGVEAVLGAELAVGSSGAVLAPLVSLTINDFSFDGDSVYGDNELPAAPEYVVRGELLYRHASGVYVGPTFDIVDARWADFANTYRIDSYSLLGLRAGWANERLRVFGEIRNLRDDEYIATHGVLDVAGADARVLNPGEPRSAYFGVQARF